MRRDTTNRRLQIDLDDDLPENSYFTYRPLSNLPTPPPSSRESCLSQLSCDAVDQDESLQPKFRGKLSHCCIKTKSDCVAQVPQSTSSTSFPRPPRYPSPLFP